MKHLISILLLTAMFTSSGQQLSSELGYAFLPETVMRYDSQQPAVGGFVLCGSSYLYYRSRRQKTKRLKYIALFY
jgi:hypothetical protein